MAREEKIHFPLYQIKSFGVVVDHTNSESSALQTFRAASKPAELWRVHANGAADALQVKS